MRLPVLCVNALLCSAMVLAGCTNGDADRPRDVEPSDPGADRSVSLDCTDAAGRGGGDIVPQSDSGLGSLVVGDLVIQLAVADQSPEARVSDEFTNSPPDDDRYIWKAPVIVTGAEPVTVELVAPEAAGLAWVPDEVWHQVSRIDITEYEATAVTFAGCPDRDLIYLGGLLLDERATCLSLRISQAGALVANVEIPFGDADCPSG